ncbi:MAG: hypothetical protein AB7O63_13175 [Reyranellaceae bacterium]
MVARMDDQAARLAALDQQVDALLDDYRAAIDSGKHAEAEAILDRRDEVALEAGLIRGAIEQAQLAAAARRALAGALVDLDLDPVHPITTTRAGLKLPGGITLALQRRAA